MADSIRIPNGKEETLMQGAADATRKHREEEAKRKQSKQTEQLLMSSADNSKKRREDSKVAETMEQRAPLPLQHYSR
ncbi:uncharacterized protein F4812DRAFT_459052 [Daldinia caldariorum]|uniref:uncharacterized protein n=1 Tax=Daldinia caldariorum TaxID=326644 RepID=UPI002007B6B9|nr:uncharacterized protein F4812DRAFT_459052 [Daldinia caldariorum]KAI1467763.1 hypothetical protein F4812DRAFT_459052 [Daldinia caldariorum]